MGKEIKQTELQEHMISLLSQTDDEIKKQIKEVDSNTLVIYQYLNNDIYSTLVSAYNKRISEGIKVTDEEVGMQVRVENVNELIKQELANRNDEALGVN